LKKLLITTLLIFSCNIKIGHATDLIHIDSDFNSEMLINFFKFYYDKDGEIENGLKSPLKKSFIKSITKHTGYFKESMWVKFEIEYDLENPHEYIINFDNHILSEIVLYQVEDKKLKKIDQTGELLINNKTGRDLKLHLLSPLLKGRVQYYIRAKGKDLINLNAIIRSVETHDKFKEDNSLVVGFYYGCLITIIIITYFFTTVLMGLKVEPIFIFFQYWY
jgi:hypothetical protein